MEPTIVKLSPMLQLRLDEYKDRRTEPSGFLVGNMDKLNFTNEVNLVGGYLVCAQKIMLKLKDHFTAIGPGGGLVGGSSIYIDAPKITLKGHALDPIIICAEDILSLNGENGHFEYVAFVIYRSTRIILDINQLSFGALAVFEMDKNTGKILKKFQFTNPQGFFSYCAEKKKEAEDFDTQNMINMETVQRMKLKSILV